MKEIEMKIDITTSTKFNEPSLERPHPIGDGIQKFWKFKNSYGASVVQLEYSYTDNEQEWELAVIKFKDDDWQICYDTEITEDVMGHLSVKEVEKILKKIKGL